ncbi:hypothetical protein OUZ56_022921 [Daphnia magna]|uniref:Uncharacterized protein n=1 Tax=Daphnia magna TaxID=35525 RepID=A0ABR0AXV5_9CRUS|nr:hypothetical protein OUZ56_022921 [Daphnia magna]
MALIVQSQGSSSAGNSSRGRKTLDGGAKFNQFTIVFYECRQPFSHRLSCSRIIHVNFCFIHQRFDLLPKFFNQRQRPFHVMNLTFGNQDTDSG